MRPSYTAAQNQSGFGGGSAAAWSTTANENNARRDRANYAWAHPTRRRGPTAAEAGAARPDPFETDEFGRVPMNDHFVRFAAREARSRARAAKFGSSRKGFSSGTDSFGAKAEVRTFASAGCCHQLWSGADGCIVASQEESRLINDSAVARSSQVCLLISTVSSMLTCCLQVIFVFAGAFAIAMMFSRGRHKESERAR